MNAGLQLSVQPAERPITVQPILAYVAIKKLDRLLHLCKTRVKLVPLAIERLGNIFDASCETVHKSLHRFDLIQAAIKHK